jgi:hypothetical protein
MIPRNTIENLQFSARLNTLADEAQIPQRGRQRILGGMFGSGQKGARRWLIGNGFPQLQKCIEMSMHFGVHLEWLMTGRGPKNVLAKDDPYLMFINIFTSLPDEIKRPIVAFAASQLSGDPKKMEGIIQCLELSGVINTKQQ